MTTNLNEITMEFFDESERKSLDIYVWLWTTWEGIEVYDFFAATNLNKNQVLQSSFMQLLLNIDRWTPTVTLFQILLILKKSNMYQVNILSIVNDIGRERCRNIFRNYFEQTWIRMTLGQNQGPCYCTTRRMALGDRQIRIKEIKLGINFPKIYWKADLKSNSKQIWRRNVCCEFDKLR